MKLLSERTTLTLVFSKLHWLIFLCVWMFDSMYLCVSLVYVCGTCGSQKTRVGSLGFGIVDGHETQYCCWEGNLSFLKEQQLPFYSVLSHQLWKTYFTWHDRPIILFTTNGQEIFIWERCKIPAWVLQNEILNNVKYEIRFNLGVLNHRRMLNYHLEKDST